MRRVALAVAVLVILGADAFVLTQRDVATPVRLSTALREFRTPHPAAGAFEARTATAQAAVPAAPVAAPAAGAVPASAPAVATSTASGVAKAAAGASASSRAPALPPSTSLPAAFSAPAEGVYAYNTTGGESISIAGAHHDYPPASYATIHRADGGAWTLDWPVLKEHVDHYRFDSVPGRELELSEGQDVTFFGKTDGATYNADPAQINVDVAWIPGSVVHTALGGPAGSAEGTVRFVGREPVHVGTDVVQAYHVVLDLVLHGKAEGTTHVEWWLQPTTGLAVRMTRTLDSEAHAVFGNVHYKEHATFDLQSLTPQT